MKNPESAPMNSDHAPTAEEQLPELHVKHDPDAVMALCVKYGPEFTGWEVALAALRENRELRKCCNLGGNPLRLDGVHVKCAADPKDEHEIYGGGIRQPDGRIFCELHAHRATCAEKDARIAELERKGMWDSDMPTVREAIKRAEAAEAKLRAVSDALDEASRGANVVSVRWMIIKPLLARIRAIVEGKDSVPGSPQPPR